MHIFPKLLIKKIFLQIFPAKQAFWPRVMVIEVSKNI
jgi:hypothetical protein